MGINRENTIFDDAFPELLASTYEPENRLFIGAGLIEMQALSGPAADWKITKDTVVQPDNIVICYLTTTAFLPKVPSLTFEILLTATVEKYRHTKYSIYEKEGFTYYCIVDQDNNVAKIYRLSNGKFVQQMDATDMSFEFDLVKCRIALAFASIWSD